MAAGSADRFIFSLSAALAAALSGEISLLILLLLALISAFYWWEGNLREISRIAKLAFIFFILIFLLHLFSGEGEVLFYLWILKATSGGAISGLLYGLKLIVFVFSAYIIFFRVDPVELASPLERLAGHIGPFGRYLSAFAISFYLAMRFLPDLSRQARTTMMAFKSRGIELKGSISRKAKVVSMLVTSVFVGSFKRAEAVSVALSVKGYSTRYARAMFPPVKMRVGGVFILLFSASMIIGGWFSR